MKNFKYIYGGYSFIIGLVLAIPMIIFEVLMLLNEGVFIYEILFKFFFFLVFLSSWIGIYAFWLLSKKTKNKLLKIICDIELITIPVFYSLFLFDIISSETDNPTFWIMFLIMIVYSSILTIFWGIGVLKLQKKFGSLAKTAGILNIVGGGLLITIILFPLGMILSGFVALIYEIIILFKAQKIIK